MQPLVFIIAVDMDRAAALRGLLETVCGARVRTFMRLKDAHAAAQEESGPPRLILTPWRDAEQTALAFQRDLRRALGAETPYLLIFTPGVSPTKISLVARAGKAELIPNAPLDMRALTNRTILLLHGAEALGDRLWGDEAARAEAEAASAA